MTPPARVDQHGFSSTIGARLQARLKRMPNGCLEWTGAKRSGGYGNLGRGPKGGGNEAAHRVAWILRNGSIPEGLIVCHRCDNPPCCEVDHLFLGTPRDNMVDKVNKGRGRAEFKPGEAHVQARLSDADVAALRAEYPNVGNYAEIGRRYGITKQHARALVLHSMR